MDGVEAGRSHPIHVFVNANETTDSVWGELPLCRDGSPIGRKAGVSGLEPAYPERRIETR